MYRHGVGIVVLGVLLATAAVFAADGRDARPGLGQPKALRAAAAAFNAKCARCHGTSGRSDTDNGRALKVAPLRGHPRLQRMTPADIASAVKANPKHHGVVELEERDIDAAAPFVKHLAGQE
jgi:hypothetical protein